MNSKILFVDDDENILAAVQRNLRKQFTVDTAQSGLQGLEQIRTQGPYAVIISDMSMPSMNGAEFLEAARRLAPDTVRIMLTGNADQQTAADAVNRGHVFRFLSKPCPPEMLVPAIEHGLKQYQLLQTERELLEGTLTGSVKMMSEVLGMVSPDALGRGQRLRESMRTFAHFIGAESVWALEVAALLSPIGFASMPSSLLQKISSGFELLPAEQALVNRVPQVGHDLLVDIPRLEGVAQSVLFQSKAFDGTGFPAGNCVGKNIPLGARMLKILNDRLALEAEGTVKQRALDAMRLRAGQYDPLLLEQSFQCFQAFLINAMSADRPVRSLLINQLTVDQVVVSDICTLKGLVLVGAGNRLTSMVLQRLQNYDTLGDVKQPVMVQDPAPVVTPA